MNTSKKTKRLPTQQDKSNAIDLFLNRLEQAFVFYFWVRKIRPAISKKLDAQHYVEAVQNACLQSTLICIRDLNDFFSNEKKKYESDLRAKDFDGYKSQGCFLVDSMREE